ncbi:hypothetical protein PFISCL1PPCAC_24739, partial [Pristionchus fissidentatus]
LTTTEFPMNTAAICTMIHSAFVNAFPPALKPIFDETAQNYTFPFDYRSVAMDPTRNESVAGTSAQNTV